MDRFIARANVNRYQRLLEQTTDPAERARSLNMLADEERKLNAAETEHVVGPAVGRIASPTTVSIT